MSEDPETRILEAWREAAGPWTRAVREGRIASRRRVTDAVVLSAVEALKPMVVLDAGCGEGWLVRALRERGMEVAGVDAVSTLIERARAVDDGDYRVLAYDRLTDAAREGGYDAVVFNFALLGDASTRSALAVVPGLLAPGGTVVIQTLHPDTVGGDEGWRAGSWEGCGDGFGAAAPWYFRTTDGWLRLLAECGLETLRVESPRDPDTDRPLSLLITARPD